MSYESVLKDAEARMEKAVSHTSDMLKNIRTSRASSALVDGAANRGGEKKAVRPHGLDVARHGDDRPEPRRRPVAVAELDVQALAGHVPRRAKRRFFL